MQDAEVGQSLDLSFSESGGANFRKCQNADGNTVWVENSQVATAAKNGHIESPFKPLKYSVKEIKGLGDIPEYEVTQWRPVGRERRLAAIPLGDESAFDTPPIKAHEPSFSLPVLGVMTS